MGILVWRDQSNIYFPPRNIFPQQFKDFAAQDDFQLLCGRDAASMRQLAGYGFGLPLSRVYAQLLGFWKFMMGGDSVYVYIYIHICHIYVYIYVYRHIIVHIYCIYRVYISWIYCLGVLYIYAYMYIYIPV